MRRIAVFVVCYIIWCIYVWPYSATYGWDGQSLIVGLIASFLVAALLSDTLARHPSKFSDLWTGFSNDTLPRITTPPHNAGESSSLDSGMLKLDT